MRLARVAIHNFRCLIEAEFDINDYALLVGANNSGKTCVIDAIRCFYEADLKYNQTRDFPQVGSQDVESWIDLTFTLSDDEWGNLPDRYKHTPNTLKVRKYFAPPPKSEHKPNIVYGYEKDSLVANEPIFGAKGVQQGKFGTLIHVPAVSRIDDHTKMTGPSALRDLVNGILRSVIDKSESYKSLADHFEKFAGRVKSEKSSDGRCIAGLEERLNELLGGWGAKFALTIRKPEVADIVKNLVDSDLVDDAHRAPLKPEQYGAGLQRHLIYSLIRLTAEYVEPPAPKAKKEFSPDFTLLLFEEPEVFLHPPQQDVMWRDICNIVETSQTWSVVCSTHSAHLVSSTSATLRRIVRLARSEGVARAFGISDAAWKEIVDRNQMIERLRNKFPHLRFGGPEMEWDDKEAFEANQYLSWLSPDRSCCVFARHVILVEGPTERLLFYRLMEDGWLGRHASGVYILDCIGKYNIHRCMQLLGSLGIRHSVIADSDEDKNNSSPKWTK